MSLSNTECILSMLILSHSPTDITLLYKSKGQKDYIKGTQEHISESIEISVMQSVIEWLLSYNLIVQQEYHIVQNFGGGNINEFGELQ